MVLRLHQRPPLPLSPLNLRLPKKRQYRPVSHPRPPPRNFLSLRPKSLKCQLPRSYPWKASLLQRSLRPLHRSSRHLRSLQSLPRRPVPQSPLSLRRLRLCRLCPALRKTCLSNRPRYLRPRRPECVCPSTEVPSMLMNPFHLPLNSPSSSVPPVVLPSVVAPAPTESETPAIPETSQVAGDNLQRFTGSIGAPIDPVTRKSQAPTG